MKDLAKDEIRNAVELIKLLACIDARRKGEKPPSWALSGRSS